ncbi:MAG TPA: hypothetical protein VHK69_20125 [Chitinophagaceae bacterium]|jgi:hypothetical protein|nr:hypothetical protein [Chitinophagaceae bacterium]
MNYRNPIWNELQELGSTLPGGPLPTPYAVPAGYFEGLAEAVLRRIRAAEKAADPAGELEALSPLLAGLPKKMPFSVPDGYFNELSSLPSGEELPSLLRQADRTVPYTVPAGYFEQLPQQILERVRPSGAKVVSFPRTFLRYAAAAVVTGALALGAWMYLGSRPSGTDAAPSAEQWVSNKLQNVSTQELNAFIEETGLPVTEGKEMAQNWNEVRKLVKDIPKSEIDAFLSQLPEEEELLIN